MLRLYLEQPVAIQFLICAAGFHGLIALLYLAVDLPLRLFPPPPEPEPTPEPPETADPPEPEPEEPEIFERPEEKPAQRERFSVFDDPLLLCLGCMFIPGFIFVVLGVWFVQATQESQQDKIDSRKGRSLLTPEEAVARAAEIEHELARTGKAPKA